MVTKLYLYRILYTLAVLWTLRYIPSTEAQDIQITPSQAPITSTPMPLDLDLLPIFERLAKAHYENCELPCWWGLTPGKTSLKDVANFVQDNNLIRQWERSLYSTLPLEDYLRGGEFVVLSFQQESYLQGGSFQMHFGFDKEDVLSLSVIGFRDPGDWLTLESDHLSLPKMFSQLEEIPDIYIFQNIRKIASVTEDEPATYTYINPRFLEYPMIIVYEDHNMVIHYNFRLVEIEDEQSEDAGWGNFLLCPGLEQTDSIDIRLYKKLIFESPDADRYATPEDALGLGGISTQDFVEFFRENPEDCLEVVYNRADD